MMYRRQWHSPPPWWPANEPWPPVDRARMWRRGRGRFMRRVAVVFAAVLFLSVIGAATVVSKLLGERTFDGRIWYVPPSAIAIVSLVLVLGLLLPAIRRIGLPLGNIVEAANRVADGDFSTRIPEEGPPSLRTVGRAFNSMAARLQSQDRQRRHLMAEIAHELRTPLSVVQGRLEGLLDGVYARDDVQINQVLEETRILARLVDDLRTLANAESGMLTLKKESTDISILIQDVVNSFSTETTDRNVSIRFETPADLPLVNIDPLRVREVLANLLSNALRHTPAGNTVSIKATLSNDRLRISVVDTGTGIAPEDLPKIFDRFYKGSTSRGSGLGLTIARNFVAAHGGEIWAESQPGHGTTVTFTLPLALA